MDIAVTRPSGNHFIIHLYSQLLMEFSEQGFSPGSYVAPTPGVFDNVWRHFQLLQLG